MEPSVPDSGELFTENSMDMVGSSTLMAGKRARVFGIAERIPDKGVFHPGHGCDITGRN